MVKLDRDHNLGILPITVNVATDSGLIRIIRRSSGEIEPCLATPHSVEMYICTPSSCVDLGLRLSKVCTLKFQTTPFLSLFDIKFCSRHGDESILRGPKAVEPLLTTLKAHEEYRSNFRDWSVQNLGPTCWGNATADPALLGGDCSGDLRFLHVLFLGCGK